MSDIKKLKRSLSMKIPSERMVVGLISLSEKYLEQIDKLTRLREEFLLHGPSRKFDLSVAIAINECPNDAEYDEAKDCGWFAESHPYGDTYVSECIYFELPHVHAIEDLDELTKKLTDNFHTHIQNSVERNILLFKKEKDVDGGYSHADLKTR